MLWVPSALAGELAVTRWSRAEGLGADDVVALERHGRRLLVTTSHGRQWFDGERFWPVAGEPGPADPEEDPAALGWSPADAGPGLASPERVSLAEGGRLWLGGPDGLYRIQPSGIRQVPPPGSTGFVDAIWVDRHERLWQRVPGAGWWSEVAGWLRVEGVSGLDGASLAEPPASPMWIGADRLYTTRAVGDVFEARPLPGAPDLGTIRVMEASLLGSTWIGGTGVIGRWDGVSWSVVREASGAPLGAIASITAAGVDVAAAVDDLGGVVLVEGETAKRLGVEDGLPSARVNAVSLTPRLALSTADRGLCVSTAPSFREGLAGAAWVCLGADGPIGTNDVRGAARDGGGNLWVCTSGGVFRLDEAGLAAALADPSAAVSPLHLGPARGVRGRACPLPGRQPSYFGPRGEVGFASTDGALWIQPAAVRIAEPPRPELVAVQVGDRWVDPARVDRLDAASDGARLYFSAPDLAWGAWARLRYRVGSDAWVPIEPGAPVVLGALPTRPLSLEVEAAGVDGAWSEPVRVAVARAARWDERVETRMGALLALGLVFVGTVRVSGKALRRRAEALEAEVSAQTDALRRQNAVLSEKSAALVHTADELRQRTEALAAADRLKSEFVANVAHELRTPLMLVMGALDDLSRGARRDAALREASANVERLSDIAGSLLDLARLDGAGLPLRARRLDLSVLVEGLVDRFRGEAGRAGLDLQVVAEEPVATWADAELVNRIVTNLVGNAMSFARARVTVRVARAEGDAVVVVEDDGPGIPEEALDRVFERFVQLDTGDARRHSGVGIGLSLSRELAEQHGGAIAAGRSPLGGARFELRLPLGPALLCPEEVDLGSVDPSAESWRVPRREGAPRLLLVEDHPRMRQFLAEQLAETYDVLAVGDGLSAVRLASAEGVQLVVSDIMMPGMDGLELCRRLATDPATREIPRVLISAKGGEAVAREALEFAAAFLPKPFRVPQLLEVLARLVPWRDGPPDPEAVSDAPPEEHAPQVIGGERGPGAPTPAMARQFERVVAHFERHLATPEFGVEELARASALSVRSLQRLVTAVTGVAPSRWMREHRLRLGRELLRSGRAATVGEAAAAVGMSRAYFTRAYVSTFGVPPGQDG